MKSDTPLDYAVFQLSPKRSRCELFVCSDGKNEKLASGLVKPFVTHLKVAEEQVALLVRSIKLEVERHKNAEAWFTKGTLERFVRFVSTPEVLEQVNIFDEEMFQLEAARRIYSERSGYQLSSTSGGGGSGVMAAADATKKELLRAIDVRLVAVRQDLTTACARAAAAGFDSDTVSELQMFADQFGAHRLSEACSKFMSLCERRADLINPWKAGGDDRATRSSYGSNMSIDEELTTPDQHHIESHQSRTQTQCQHQHQHQHQHVPDNKHPTGREPDTSQWQDQHHHLEQSKSSTCQQHKPSSIAFQLRRSRESSVEEEDNNRESDWAFEEEKKEGSSGQTESSQISQPARRLSVQDRINLFENKQKENSGSDEKPAVGKSAELRRLSSDVSSTPAVVEKAVLRRWSGSSDMSIDLSGEKKEIENSCTPSSSVAPTKSQDRKGLNNTATSAESEIKFVPTRVGESVVKDQLHSQVRVGVTSDEVVVATKVGTNSGIQLTVSSHMSDDAPKSNKILSITGIVDGSKDQPHNKTQSRSFLGRAENNSLKDQANSQTQFRLLPCARAEQLGLADQGTSKGSLGNVASATEVTGLKDLIAPTQPQFGAFASRAGDNRFVSGSSQLPHVEFQNRVEDDVLRDQSVSQSNFRSPGRSAVDSVELEGGSGSKIREAFAHYRGADSDLLASYPRWRSFGEVEEVGKKDLSLSEKQSGSSATKVEDSGLRKMEFQKLSVSEEMKKSHGRRDESSNICDSSRTLSSGKMVSEDQERFGSISTVPAKQVRRVRQSKGNQELNDELKVKATELENLFAEHKLRVPGDQSNSIRRNKPADVQIEQAASLPYSKPMSEVSPAESPDKNMLTVPFGSSSDVTKFNASSLIEVVDNHDYSDALNQNFSELVFSEDSRGKFYDRYTQKRDAKLKEEWGTKRVEKEVKLKAMQDSFERSRAEMKAKFSGSADRHDSVLSARCRAERLRSFNIRSTMKTGQRQLDFVDSEDDEDLSELPEQKPFGQDRSFSGTSFGDSVSRSTRGKKLLPNKNLHSSTPRTSTPVPRSVVKASNFSLGRRRMQSENPLAQSVPIFSYLRKENTKPSSAASQTASRPQLRNYARGKSTSGELPVVKEEKPCQSQSLREISESPAEIRDMSPMSSPLKFDKEQKEQTLHEKFSKNVESRPFFWKGGVDPGAGVGISKQKDYMAYGTMNNEDDSDELVFEPDNPVAVVKDDDEEEFDTMTAEHHANFNRGEPRLSQETEKVVKSGCLPPSEVVEKVPSTFHPIESVQDSPGESPVSWNSRVHHPLSYPHEASDIDASPMGSPASWNSHSLIQAEADAARIRKIWGSAQTPMLVANSSNNQSRKDVTKGFKRLLKFGRKSRGTDSMADWISATTSEGDDDTEDGRDHANRSSEDLRKSRMGFLQGHPSDDSFSESEFFSEQVQALNSSIPTPPVNFKLREDHLSGSSIKAPRSFFSLSSFRSKGSDSKPR